MERTKSKRLLSVLLTLAMLLSLVPAMGVTASAAGTEIEAVSFTYTGYAEGENVADAVVTCNTVGVDFTYKWRYSNSGGSSSDATELSAQFISGIEYTLWIYFKAQDGLALAELNKTDVTLGGNNPGIVYRNNYTIDEVNYSYGVPFSMSPLGGVTKYIVGFYTQGGKIGDESYRVELVTGTDGKLTAEQVPTPTREGYIFDGWYTAKSGGTLLSLDTVYTGSRNRYYARWAPTVDIDVTFDANGGKVNGKDTDTITIPAADKGKLASLPVPTREGYTFDGWYTAASGGMKITETTVFSEATTVYALWGAIDSVSFTYTGYAEGENVADAVVTCNTVGVDFTYKWRYSNSGGSSSDATELSAQFISGIEYTLWIYFKAQDGLALAELNKTDVTLGGNNPGIVYRNNYTIDEVNYSYGVPFSMSPLGGVTKYIVGFYTQGGKIGDESYRVELVTGTDGKLTAEQVPTPTREGYIFDGWYTAKSGGTLLSLDTVYTDSRNEYYARWKENTALTGTATITGTAKFGQTLTASLESGNNTGTLSYQWKRGGSDISGAMNSTYTLVNADIGWTITVEISSSEETGTIVSPATATVGKADTPAAPTGLSGMMGKTLATVPLTGGWAWADDTTVMSAAGTQTFKANYTDATGNYENATNVDVTVEVIDKTNVSASITFADGELIYNGAGQAYETASISGITAGANPGWTYAYAPSGTGSLDASGKPQNAGTYTVTATYEDDDNYGTKSAVLKIKKAVPTGTPKYMEITTAGKTLADAAITTTGADFSVPGAVIWVADDGVTPLPDTTVVAANTYYKWLFTPTDTDNYETLTGTIRLYRRSSGGGGGSTPVQPTAPAADGAVQVAYTVSGGTAALSLPESKVNDIIARTEGDTAVINLSKVSGVTSAELPKAALIAFEKAGLDVSVELPGGIISMSQEAAADIADQTTGANLKMELKQAEAASLTTEQKEAVKTGDMVLDINIYSGTKKITDFDGILTIEIPYSGPQPVAVWYLNDKGELEKLTATFKDGVVSFALNHLSLYVVGLDTAWVSPFTDIKEADWFYAAVEYAYENGLMVGTSTNTFSPHASTTRAMVVTILHRLEELPAANAANTFGDVADGAWYTDAVLWAAEQGIVSGYGNDKFGPEDAITREQMAAILYRYAQYKGYDITGRADLSKFADADVISSWAQDAMSWASAAKLIQGDGTKLSPAGNAERCQVAAILQRFIENFAK